ncbi:MAG: TetR/AcrR family transcriptional regulator [Acidimicrobiia bacterium]
MVTARTTRDDVIEAAGRLFASRGYHGTSMRDLGRELGMLGSSLYAHIDSKQDLLVEVVERGAQLFEASARSALYTRGGAGERLKALIRGHVGVVLDNLAVARTFLNEARMLDDEHRKRVVAARDRYEAAFRQAIAEGIESGAFRDDVNPKLASIFVLSVLNAIERWYRPEGTLDRESLVEALTDFVTAALS